MSTTRDTSLQSDFNKLTIEADGTFKRQASSFRSTIEKGGKFEAEVGQDFQSYCHLGLIALLKVATASTFPMHAVSQTVMLWLIFE